MIKLGVLLAFFMETHAATSIAPPLPRPKCMLRNNPCDDLVRVASVGLSQAPPAGFGTGSFAGDFTENAASALGLTREERQRILDNLGVVSCEHTENGSIKQTSSMATIGRTSSEIRLNSHLLLGSVNVGAFFAGNGKCTFSPMNPQLGKDISLTTDEARLGRRRGVGDDINSGDLAFVPLERAIEVVPIPMSEKPVVTGDHILIASAMRRGSEMVPYVLNSKVNWTRNPPNKLAEFEVPSDELSAGHSASPAFTRSASGELAIAGILTQRRGSGADTTLRFLETLEATVNSTNYYDSNGRPTGLATVLPQTETR